jgi:hypothetical protein
MSDLPLLLDDDAPGILVDKLPSGIWRLLVPNPRSPHEYVTIVVERIDGGWSLSDAGEVSSIRGVNFDKAVRLLVCSGADVDAVDGFVTITVEDDVPLLGRVLEFAHYITAAPILWRARDCLMSDPESGAELPPESAVRILARETRHRLISNLPPQAAPLVQLDRRLRTRDEDVRVPLVVAATNIKSLPLLAAAFVDMTASERAVSAAKRTATWMFEVLAEHQIPKYLVVRGSPSDVEHFTTFYDNLNIAAIPSDDGAHLIEDAQEAVRRLGFPLTR